MGEIYHYEGATYRALQAGDQVADTDGLAAEAMDRRMYGHSFTLNGERVDPLCVSVDAAGALTAGTAPFRHAVTPGAWSDASVAADKARIASLEKALADLYRASELRTCGEMAMRDRIAELEVENARLSQSRSAWRAAALDLETKGLRGEERSGQPPRLSAGWHHLPDVTAPDRAFPTRALRFGGV